MKTVACLQFQHQPQWQEQVDQLLAQSSGIDLMVFPELCHVPYFCLEEHTKWKKQAITCEHPIFSWAKQLAKTQRFHLVFPFFEQALPYYYNSAALIDDQGNILGIYRKTHIPQDPGFSEKFHFRPGGEALRPIPSRLGSIGLLICWDQWFPEAARCMAAQGAEILCYPTAIGWDLTESETIQQWQPQAWQIAQQAHALCNQIPVAVANRWGKEPCLPSSLQFWGKSFIASADGQIQAQASSDQNQLIVANWQTADAEHWQQHWHFWRDRRVDLYQQHDAFQKK